ncbi:hypothetical protein PPYR_14282 [Photinus pyralis]|uniref:Luciferin 4-monooxygenase n=1 Tax=Photinus pyralis TaxID=7054 RepID=A0A5N4A4S4_PHOPY|nr:4-coumarate--CoA ligase 1-like [Photinus pyralis]KAB0792323.1 hypothetical protein PPYR_14282 [Photinus pyralis]
MASTERINLELDSNVIRGETPSFVLEPKGLGYALFECMSRNRHLIAQIDPISGVKDTYEHLLGRCVGAALKMRSIGIRPKDVITTCTLNHLNSCVPVIAAIFLGAIPACLDPRLGRSEMTHHIKLAKPKIAFVDQGSIELVEETCAEAGVDVQIVTFAESDRYTEFGEFVTERDDEFHPYEVGDGRETASILFSSGTTGLPKGICLSHQSLLGQGNLLISRGICFQTTLTYSTYHWLSATFALVSAVLTGGCRVVTSLFTPRTFWTILERYSITNVLFTPVHAMELLRNGRPEAVNTSQLRDVIIGGDILSSHPLEELRAMFPGTNCNLSYGQTELSGLIVNFNRLDRREMALMRSKPGSSGLLVPGFSCKIVEPSTGATLGPNQTGELCFKGDFVMNGYYNSDSSDRWDADGWLRTGDLGYYDEDFCFFIVDRIKETFKVKSFHISPSFIEGVLLTHPAISLAAVVGLPDEENGNAPLAVVCLKEGSHAVGEEDVVKYVAERMHDKYALRGGVKFVDTLPLTTTGKIKKYHLRELIISGKL